MLSSAIFKVLPLIVIHVEDTLMSGAPRTFHDKKDACMNVALDTFCMQVENDTGNAKALFKLHPLDKIKLRFKAKSKINESAIENDLIIAKCAAQSLLQKLRAQKLVESEIIKFFVTRGDTTQNLSLQMVAFPKDYEPKKFDTVSSVTVDLDKLELQINFVTLSTRLREEIIATLSKLAKHETKPSLKI